jgi:hypothetical protein
VQPGTTPLAPTSSEITVLLVAADPFRAALLEATLADATAVHRVSGEDAALSAATRGRFDVCVIDETPGRAAASSTLTSLLRRAQPDIPIILCSPGLASRPAGLLTVAEPLVASHLLDAVDLALGHAPAGV